MIPPSLKAMAALEIHSYPGPSAEDLRQFCLMTGGTSVGGDTQRGQGGRMRQMDAQQLAFGTIRFRHDSVKPTAEYVLVRDRHRAHRYQQPGTNPHLLRFLLEDVWALPQPGLVVEITGSAQGLALSKEQRTDIMQSIMMAAQKMDGWIVTGVAHVCLVI